ncbi:hypothetical protein AYO44_18225 [Planctomycetaceae bacterium SCGC AG-212-F19]|nr:hypothetical protein AYO44_18225 [Planctomycetaceae bacterium SCGC AG-212-F19]
MRRLLMFGALLLAGCKVAGPLEHNRNPQRVDDPFLPIPEQEKRGRDRMSLPEFESTIAPRTYTDFPGPHGR